MKKLWILMLVFNAACSVSKKPAETGEANVPACITQLIKKFEAEKKQNPPRSIYSYRYNNKTVYYISPLCCDQYSDLYDSNCNLAGHPDGGFTGKGDGTLGDFDSVKTEERLVWKDNR